MICCGCMEWDYGYTEDFSFRGRGLFIINEGNFQYGNASLSYYNPDTKAIENEVFFRSNAMKLGDVAQSITVMEFVGGGTSKPPSGQKRQSTGLCLSASICKEWVSFS